MSCGRGDERELGLLDGGLDIEEGLAAVNQRTRVNCRWKQFKVADGKIVIDKHL
jgi:hypothetical protein